MIRKNTLLLTLICIITFSCSKKEENIDPVNVIDSTIVELNNNFPLVIGNYWIYEFFTKLPDGSVSFLRLDTLKVIGDTILQSRKYFVLETDQPSNGNKWIIRDSSGYIVNLYNQVMLTPSPDMTEYNNHYGFIGNTGDTAFYYYDIFPRNAMVNTKLGVYECIEQLATHQSFLQDRKELIDTSYFSKIGPVQRSYSYLSGGKMIGKLIDYQLIDN